MRLLDRPASIFLSIAMGLGAGPVSAAIGVRFIEGAPKDRFEITNQSARAVMAADIVIDLSASPAGLVLAKAVVQAPACP